VVDDQQNQLPFTVRGKVLRFFAGAPGTVRVLTDHREQVYSLTLPEIGERVWEAPKSAKRGMPGHFDEAVSRDIWQWLAILGGLGLLAEWLIYGRYALTMVPLKKAISRLPLRKAS
jgi:hypothetical protein